VYPINQSINQYNQSNQYERINCCDPYSLHQPSKATRRLGRLLVSSKQHIRPMDSEQTSYTQLIVALIAEL